MNQNIWFILEVLIFICLTTKSFGQNETLCNPIANCEDLGVAGIKIPDPTNCHNYYICLEGSDVDGNPVIKPSDQPIPCDPGDYFQTDLDDQSLSECRKENDSCINVCANRQCLSFCKADLQVIAAPNNCSFYYFCVPDTDPVPILCTIDAPYFNGIECTNNPFECCDICTPYCAKAFTEVVDPKDCTSYYLCSEDDTLPTEKYSCGADKFFNPVTGFCEENGSEGCISLC